ncbi:HpcH/HpaI aldolase/citrate lyase family protein [Chloroflexota bacterium]
MKNRQLMRSLLFVPGDQPERMKKAVGLNADVLIMDLEDSVAPNEKVKARKCVADFLDIEHGTCRTVFVRTNSLDSELLRSDLEAIVRPGISGVILPKVDSARDIDELAGEIDILERGAGLESGSLRIIGLIESAIGVIHAFEIAEASPRMIALALGAEDYALDMGIERSAEGTEIFYPRSVLAVAARAGGIFSIDTPYVNVRDEAGLVEDAKLSRRQGFTGKLVIHPDQIRSVNQIFAPSAEEVTKARQIVEAFQSALSQGAGVTVVEGRMVDTPVYENARKLLEIASSIENSEEG